MRPVLLTCLLSTCSLAPAFAQAPPPAAAPPPAPALSAAECEVWARELAFAQSVADHDAEAFADLVHPQAAFGVKGPRPTRGREAIVQEWSGLISGQPVQLQWYPTMVAIAAGDPTIASSSGPALYRGTDPQGKPFQALGGFQSIWKRAEDGTWRVLFDDGIRPAAADEAQVATFLAGRQPSCPRG